MSSPRVNWTAPPPAPGSAVGSPSITLGAIWDSASTIVVESIVGSTFTGTVVEATELGGYPAVIPEIEGEAHILGRSEYWIDPDDQLGVGFLVR